MTELPRFVSEHHLVIGDTHFHCEFPVTDAPPGRLPMLKTRVMVEAYSEIVEQLRPARIVELGIRHGGSTAMLYELARPDKVIALELSATPAPALTGYIDDHDRGDAVRPYYGVNQADRKRLNEIMDAELGDEPIDLVVDDASHLYEETRSSFETLFPRLHPGAVFIVEDWCGSHRMMNALVESLKHPDARQLAAIEDQMRAEEAGEVAPPPLSQLAAEVVLARAASGDVVAEVTMDRYWIRIRRGPASIDPETFRLADLYDDRFGVIRQP